MKLIKLLEGIKYELISGDIEVDVSDIAYDSRKVCENGLFLAYSGSSVDGHDYIDNAITSGAVAVIVLLLFG